MAKAKKQKFPEVLYVQQSDVTDIFDASDTLEDMNDTDPVAVYRLEDVHTLEVTRALV